MLQSLTTSLPTASWRTYATSIGVCSLSAFCLYHYRRRRKKLQKNLTRNLSFTSLALAVGSCPPSMKSPQAIVHCSLFFDPGHLPSEHDIVELAIRPLLVYDRLSMIPDSTTGIFRTPRNELDPGQLVRTIQIPKEDQLISTICSLFNEDLADNPDRGDFPWWEFVRIENQGPGRSVCLFRIHHALGDGVSFGSVLVQSVLKKADGSPLSIRNAFLPPSMMMRKRSSIEEHRQKLSLWQQLRGIGKAALGLASLPTSKFDHPTLFSVSSRSDLVHTRNRTMVLLPTIPLSFAQAMKNAANVTVNDVIFTCLSEAIRNYLKTEKCPVFEAHDGPTLQCRCLLTAALPRSMEDATIHDILQNQWFLFSCDMGLGIDDIIDRLHFIHETFLELKQSPMAWVGMFIQNHVLKWLPMWLNQQVVADSLVRHSLCVSNVPGPSKQCLFAGKPVMAVQNSFANPLPQCFIQSYHGEIFGNLVLDPNVIPNSSSIPCHYQKAIRNLAERLKVPVPTEL